MLNKFASFFSYLAHPIIIPILGLLVISNSGTYAADLEYRYAQFIYLSVFIFTLLLPAGIIPVFYYFGMTKSIKYTERRERIIPIYITLLLYIAAYLLVKKVPASIIYQKFLFAGCFSMFFLATVSTIWKISAHSIGWGGLTGLIFILSVRFNTDLMIFLIISILISGLIISSRLILNAHNSCQVYLGFIAGFIIMSLTFIL